jgi:hypothetical protein
MWGPVLAWCALELVAESIDAQNPERVALDLFDRLRLREPFARAFNELGFEGEEGWRVAGRIKVGLLIEAEVGKPEPERDEKAAASRTETTEAARIETETARIETVPEKKGKAAGASRAVESEPREKKVSLAPALWSDPDVRWLTGVHEAEGHAFFIRERYEELLWWLLMPSLLRLAVEPAPSRAAAKEMSETVQEALAEAAAAGYRVDVLTKQEEGNRTDPEELEEKAVGPLPAKAGTGREEDPKAGKS